MASGQGALGESPELLVPAFEAGVDYVVCDSLAESTTQHAGPRPPARRGAGLRARPRRSARRSRCRTSSSGATRADHQRRRRQPGRRPPARRRHRSERRVPRSADRAGRAPRRERPRDAAGPRGLPRRGGRRRALADGADVVITGRVADAALFLAPLVHEHGWAWDDWDRLAAGVVVGHLLECSDQVDRRQLLGRLVEHGRPARVGLPIAEVDADGSAVITKPAGTGGRVTFDTVREQLLYEVHDPAAYLTPDVVADFTTVAPRGRSATTASASRALADDPVRTTLQGAGVRTPPAGPARRAHLLVARRRGEGPPRPAIVREPRPRSGSRRCTSGARSTSASTASAGPTVDVDRRHRAARGHGSPGVAHRRRRDSAARCCDSSGCSRCPGRPGCRASAGRRQGPIRSASWSDSRRSSSTRDIDRRATSTSRRCEWPLPAPRPVRRALRRQGRHQRHLAVRRRPRRPTTRSSPRSPPNGSRAHFGALVAGRVERYLAPNVLALKFVLHDALGGGVTHEPAQRHPGQDPRLVAAAHVGRSSRRHRPLPKELDAAR